MYVRGQRGFTILLAIVKATPNRAFMLTTKTKNFSNTDTARTYFQSVLMVKNGREHPEFTKIFRNLGWDGFTFKLKFYDDVATANRAFKKFKQEFEILNLPKNVFKQKAVMAEPRVENAPVATVKPTRRGERKPAEQVRPATVQTSDLVGTILGALGRPIRIEGQEYYVVLQKRV